MRPHPPRRSATPKPLGRALLAAILTLALSARAASEIPNAERFYSEWRFDEGDRALALLSKSHPGEQATLVAKGYERFMAGDFPAAAALYQAAAASGPPSHEIVDMAELAQGSARATTGYLERRSAHFLFRFPAADAVLADYGLEGLEAEVVALADDLGFVPGRPITVDIVRDGQDLSAMTTLSEADIERTGTVAVSKWSRIMLTSPRAMRLGYEWQDSLAHEYVHYVVAALTFDRAPVWLQEGMAKFLEHRWHRPPGLALNPSMQHFLAKALAGGNLIGFDAMHPSMAKLPKAEDATLAFAEVTTAVACLYAQGGAAALREVLATVRDGGDARVAVARAFGGTGAWADFEHAWHKYMLSLRYQTLPGAEPLVPRYRKKMAPGHDDHGDRGPSEDEAASGEGERFLRLGNMMLMRNRTRAASVEYEKGYRIGGNSHWIFAVKLGRAYLAQGQNDRALQVIADAESTYPELPWPHLIAGQALLGKGEAEAALAPLLLSLAVNPYDPSVHCSLAEAYQRLPAAPPDKLKRAERDCQALGRP